MDIILNINLILIILFYSLRHSRQIFIPLYSFSLFLGLLTCMYLFYNYGMRIEPCTKSYVYFFSSPLLLILDLYLIYKQSKTVRGIGIKSYLKTSLTLEQITRTDKVLKAVFFYSFITTLIYTLANYYQPPIPYKPDTWGLTLLHFIWQYIYIIPMTLMFKQMGLKKFAVTILICSILYPFVLFAYAYIVNTLKI